jgi:hypothetical protein
MASISVKRFRWIPGVNELEGVILEVVSPCRKIAYLQYLTIGNLAVFARVLNGNHAAPLPDARLGALVNVEEAFVTQCRWNELVRLPGSVNRSRLPVPSLVWERFAVRVAPGIEDLNESLFLVSDGHVWRGKTSGFDSRKLISTGRRWAHVLPRDFFLIESSWDGHLPSSMIENGSNEPGSNRLPIC